MRHVIGRHVSCVWRIPNPAGGSCKSSTSCRVDSVRYDAWHARAALFGGLGSFRGCGEFLRIRRIVLVSVGALEDQGRDGDELVLAHLAVAIDIELAAQHFAVIHARNTATCYLDNSAANDNVVFALNRVADLRPDQIAASVGSTTYFCEFNNVSGVQRSPKLMLARARREVIRGQLAWRPTI